MTNKPATPYSDEQSYDDEAPVMDFFEEESYEDEEVEISAPTQTAKRATIGAVRTTENDARQPMKTTASQREPAATKYGRKVFTDKDRLGLWFLLKFPLATSKQLGIVWKIKRNSAHKRLLALRELGLVGSEEVIGMTQLWFTTKKGKDLLAFYGTEDERISRLYKLGSLNLGKLAHRLATTQVAAQLVAGASAIAKTTEIALPTGLDLMPLLIPEQYMNSTYGTMASRFDETSGRTVVDAQQAWRTQERVAQEVESGRLPVSQALAQNPGLWTLTTDYASRSYANQNHPFDLVVDLEAHRQTLDAPVSIGIEIELTPKDPVDLLRIVHTMVRQRERGSVPVVRRVIYVSHVERIFKAVKELRDRLGGHARYLLGATRLNDAEGERYTGEAWRF
ncbi:hypothetical protein E0W80_09475 [Microbacterium sp. PI-1]|uniref:hypothetical protein n=1 Tax=unclassified Microbacterium TaxID=2609290 RepID=UPI0010404B29|nr:MULTISPECIES: hypothetical protein [unclassified Microbacterium]TCJ23780.1 hypothetical protein E0W80_09475 [Microbacterium sp. PI-1]UUE20081.1 hypothetical protein LRQ07_14980 [Microbacterium sp. J1-1]